MKYYSCLYVEKVLKFLIKKKFCQVLPLFCLNVIVFFCSFSCNFSKKRKSFINFYHFISSFWFWPNFCIWIKIFFVIFLKFLWMSGFNLIFFLWSFSRIFSKLKVWHQIYRKRFLPNLVPFAFTFIVPLIFICNLALYCVSCRDIIRITGTEKEKMIPLICHIENRIEYL